MPDYLSKLDELIGNLESAMEAPKEEEFFLEEGETPKPATFRVVSAGFSSVTDRKSRPAEVYRIDTLGLLMRSRHDVARGMGIEVTTLLGKTGDGESLFLATGTVSQTQRVVGMYRIEVSVTEKRKTVVPASRRFLDCVTAGDAAGWNRWCADLLDGPTLRGLDLSHADLSGYDLCAADLSDSNLNDANLSGAMLAGANLTNCSLEGAHVAGADLFRARLPRKYMGLLLPSGLVEVESVIFV